MSLDRKLARWREAGLIDEPTAVRIAAFEHSERKPMALYALIVLGGGTVALGVISVIASNWDDISGGVKIAGDLVLAIGLALATGWAALQKRALATEVLVSVFYGFTLASLALIGQVYQLGTPTYQGLLVWSATTLPLLLLGQSRYLATLGVIGLWTTHAFAFEALFGAIHAWDRHSTDVIAPLVFASPFAYLALSRSSWLRRERPQYASTLENLAWTALLVGGVALGFAWYEDIDGGELVRTGLAGCALVVAAFGAALPKLYAGAPRPALITLRMILGFAWLSFAFTFGVPHASIEMIGALLQLAWLALFARACLQFGLIRAFNTLTALIALRVLIVYFEVFGSLLDTGLGLITGGALTLLLAWLWRRKARPLTGAEHVA